MKIAVTASSPDLESSVDPRFGRCPYFLIVDPETMEFESVENPFVGASGGAGIQAAQLVAGKDVKAVLTGSCGPNAFQTLSAAGIKVVVGVAGAIKEAVRKYASGAEFKEADGPDVPSHHGMGMGTTAGGGRRPGGIQGRVPTGTAGPQPAHFQEQASNPARREEIEALKKQSRELQQHIDRINDRIAALEKKDE